MCYLHKLVLECFKAVQTYRGHVSVLHGDRSFGWFMMAQEWKILEFFQKMLETCNDRIKLQDVKTGVFVAYFEMSIVQIFDFVNPPIVLST